jgi:hypothetical protein
VKECERRIRFARDFDSIMDYFAAMGLLRRSEAALRDMLIMDLSLTEKRMAEVCGVWCVMCVCECVCVCACVCVCQVSVDDHVLSQSHTLIRVSAVVFHSQATAAKDKAEEHATRARAERFTVISNVSSLKFANEQQVCVCGAVALWHSVLTELP